MGFFDKIKEAAIKAKCATGFHAGDYVRIQGKPACHVEKTCPDCFKYLTKIQHAYVESPEYDAPGSCVKTSKCRHCEETRQREVHERYEKHSKDDYCRIKEKCVRCGHQRLGAVEHEWIKGHSSYEADTVKYSCLRCNKEEARQKQKF